MESSPDRFPLVIGVTGHRDLRDQDVPRLEQEVAAVIAGLRRHYLHGDHHTPIIILSALAEGADRLVARVALAHGAQLIAPLPMPLDEYRRDFEPGLKPGNMAEFDALFAQALAAPVMPLHGTSLEGLRADRKKRAEQYRAVGIFIAQHCHVLLALWDENGDNMAMGGSAEVVTFKRDGIPLRVTGSPRASLDASEVGPVIDVITPRMKDGSTAEHVAVRPWGRDIIRRHHGGIIRRAWHHAAAFVAHLFRRELHDARSGLPVAQRRELETWENFEALIDLTRKFNRDADRLAATSRGPARVTQSIDYLFTDPERHTLDADARAHAMELAPLWCRLYATADTLAQDLQAQFKWDWKLLCVFGFIAFVCFAFFAHLGSEHKFFIVGYSLSFVVIFVLFARAMLGQHQARFLDYRALAEALRVAVYWKLLGIGSRHLDAKAGASSHDAAIDTNPVGMIAHAYPIMQPGELAWVKICLRTVERLDKAEAAPARKVDPVSHAIARRHWVFGQYAYFGRAGVRHNNLAETIEAYSLVLLILSPFIFAPLLLLNVLHDWYGEGHQHVFTIVIGLLPGVAAAFSGYAERLALKAQARQYDRMRMLFERAYELLPETIEVGTAAVAHTLYYELGMEAMKENAEWVAIYRQRPIQPLQGVDAAEPEFERHPLPSLYTADTVPTRSRRLAPSGKSAPP